MDKGQEVWVQTDPVAASAKKRSRWSDAPIMPS